MNKYEAFIFDMDGTLIDNMMAHHRTWQVYLKELGLAFSLEEVHQSIHGVNIEIMERLFPGQYSLTERHQLSEEKERRYREEAGEFIELVPGANEFLSLLKEKGCPMGVGTAAPENNMQFAIEKFQLDSFFDTYVHSGMVSKGKPNPEVFQLVAERLLVDVKNCIIFEDSPTGAEAASASGADVVVITTTHSEEEFAHIENIIHFISDYTGIEELNLI